MSQCRQSLSAHMRSGVIKGPVTSHTESGQRPQGERAGRLQTSSSFQETDCLHSPSSCKLFFSAWKLTFSVWAEGKEGVGLGDVTWRLSAPDEVNGTEQVGCELAEEIKPLHTNRCGSKEKSSKPKWCKGLSRDCSKKTHRWPINT